MNSDERRGKGGLTGLVGVLAIAGLIFMAGCGKSYIKVNLERPGYLPRPAWVGVYLLSQESALDDMDNAQLTDPEGVPLSGGVVYKEVYSLHPGEPARRIVREDFEREIRWVVVAAGFPNAKPCAREKVSVKEGAKLTIAVTVDEECIDVDIDD